MTTQQATAPQDAVVDSVPALIPRPVPPDVRRRRFLMAVANHTILIAVAAMFTLPFLFVLLTSVMTTDQALTTELWPRPFVWSNYAEVFERLPVFRYAFNTMTIAVLSTVGVLVSSIPVAYALARIRWRGRQAAFVVILATIMLPYQVTIVPL